MFDGIKAGQCSGHFTPEVKGDRSPFSPLWQLECRSITSHGQTDPPIEDFESGENDSKALGYFKLV